MATRPCRPNIDLKGIWQFLLPDTPFPGCATADDSDAEVSARPAAAMREDSDARRSLPRREPGRRS